MLPLTIQVTLLLHHRWTVLYNSSQIGTLCTICATLSGPFCCQINGYVSVLVAVYASMRSRLLVSVYDDWCMLPSTVAEGSLE